jgi:glycerol-3-phosphate dehydrogenase
MSTLANGPFDVAIIGGGIIGAGVARDLALRGARVALVEKGDFGGGTTSGSTRLIHGGLRYLEMLDFALVRMDLREREILLRIAPHLVKPLEFRIPFVSQSAWFKAKMRIGLLLYDALSYDRSLPGHRFLNNAETTADEPSLTTKALNGAGSYYDAQVRMPERLCLENLIDAVRHGAAVKNGCEVIAVNKTGGRIESLQVRDAASGEESELRAKVFVNATGAWFDRLQSLASGAPSRRIRTTKGIHLTCAPLVNKANVLFSPVDGRLFFVIPLLGKTWIGTTDTDYPDDPTNVRAEDEDIEYLLRSVEPFFPTVRQLPIYATNAGVRALVRQPGSESSVSRVHKVEETQPGMFSVLGGKITGYRAIAEEASDAVSARLGITAKCRTASELLPGGGPAPDSPFGALYGSRAAEVEALVPAYGLTGAQARYAVRHEFCRHLDDFLLRRTEYAFAPDMGASVAAAALDALSDELGWTAAQRQEERDRFRLAAERARSTAIPTEK